MPLIHVAGVSSQDYNLIRQDWALEPAFLRSGASKLTVLQQTGMNYNAGSQGSPICSESILLPLFSRMGKQDARALARACCVCRSFNQFGSEGSLWKAICQGRWPDVPFDSLTRMVERLGGYKKIYSQRQNFLRVRSFGCSEEIAALLPISGTGFFLKEEGEAGAATGRCWGFVSEAQIRSAVESPSTHQELRAKWTSHDHRYNHPLAGLWIVKTSPVVFKLKLQLRNGGREVRYELTSSLQDWAEALETERMPSRMPCLSSSKMRIRVRGGGVLKTVTKAKDCAIRFFGCKS